MNQYTYILICSPLLEHHLYLRFTTSNKSFVDIAWFSFILRQTFLLLLESGGIDLEHSS